MRGMLGNSPPLITERAVQNEISGKTIPWVILNWSHVPAGVSRVSIPMKKLLSELQSPAAPAQHPCREHADTWDLGGCDVPSRHLGDMYELHRPFG